MRPNILIVFSDQHRWCEVGCYGNAHVFTPHLDTFAQSAVRFENCITNCPLCVPARGTLLTGLHAMGHGALGNDLPIRPETESIARVCGRAGYRTGYVGKWHLAGVPRDQKIEPENRLGFDDEWKVANCSHRYFEGYYDDHENQRHEFHGYEPDIQTTMALDFIERTTVDNRPWLLTLSWAPPHDPYLPAPERWLDYYRSNPLTMRRNVPDDCFETEGFPYSRQEWEWQTAGYRAHISALDEQFGRLLRGLERTGQLDNTIVVYTSDHGDMLGSHGYLNKQLPYEESIHVPLIVGGPGCLRGHICRELIGLVDLPVTLTGLAGLAFESPTDGKDLSRLLREPHAKGLDACYIYDLTACHQAEDRGTLPWRGIRTRTHTYAVDWREEPVLKSDLVSDPWQRQEADLSACEPELRRCLDEFVNAHDGYMDRCGLLAHAGLVEAWNESQRYFERKEISPLLSKEADHIK